MDRRALLSAVATGAAISIAGCSDADGDAPDPETPPEELLPPEQDGWDRGDVSDLLADEVGADTGIGADYTDPDGGEYRVEILRWPDEASADGTLEETYSNWDATAAAGVFSLACNGPTDADADDLLSSSPAL